jgi:hypothetical protein
MIEGMQSGDMSGSAPNIGGLLGAAMGGAMGGEQQSLDDEITREAQLSLEDDKDKK